jgi:hypothetical protein
MKKFRTIVGEVVGQPSMTSDGSDIAALRKLYGALSKDMEATAAATSPEALQKWNRATQYWRGRQDRIDDVFSTLFGKDGKRSDEKVFNQINSWAQGRSGDFKRLARTIRSMPKDEADTVRATIVNEMGKVPPARQAGAAGDVFAPTEFSKQWQGLSQRAKSVLFPDKQHRKDLDDLSTIMEEMKAADTYQNYSRTALGVNTAIQGGLAIANWPVAATLAAMQFGAGKLLASPRFARIIASSTRLPPEKAGRAMKEQLGVLAGREPIMRSEINEFMQAMNDNMARPLAAEEPTE